MKTDIRIGKRHRHELLKKQNVVGVGVGYRQKKGRSTGEKAIVVFVSEKKAPRELARTEIVPRSVQGQQVDIVEVGEVRLLESAPAPGDPPPEGDPLARWRPAPGGVSVGHYRVTAGTLGGVVRDSTTGERFILSNNHVLANASTGKDDRASAGDAVLQPGPYDGGRLEEDVIARLERFVPLAATYQAPRCTTARFWEDLANRVLTVLLPAYRVHLERSNEEGNLVDAALARPLREGDLSWEQLGLGRVTGAGEIYPGEQVFFSGRTSGVVQGAVIARDVSLFITMERGRELYFVDQLVTSAISRPGDSGSLLLDGQNRAVGLLFAGSETVSVCNRFQNVSRLLGVSAGEG